MFDAHRHHERKLHMCYVSYVLDFLHNCFLRESSGQWSIYSTGRNILPIAVNARVRSSTVVVFVLVAALVIHTSKLTHTHPGGHAVRMTNMTAQQPGALAHARQLTLPYRTCLRSIVRYGTSACHTADRTVKYRRTTTESGLYSARMFVPWNRPSYPPFSRRLVPLPRWRSRGSLHTRAPSDMMES